MSDQEQKKESFEDFKNSFSYGSRNDLNFQFLAALSDSEAAQFIQELLWKLGDSLNDGEWSRLISHVVDWQVKGYSRPGSFTSKRKSEAAGAA